MCRHALVTYVVVCARTLTRMVDGRRGVVILPHYRSFDVWDALRANNLDRLERWFKVGACSIFLTGAARDLKSTCLQLQAAADAGSAGAALSGQDGAR